MLIDKFGIYLGFKPCYKWIPFNTLDKSLNCLNFLVLNLVINGYPSILEKSSDISFIKYSMLF